MYASVWLSEENGDEARIDFAAIVAASAGGFATVAVPVRAGQRLLPQASVVNAPAVEGQDGVPLILAQLPLLSLQSSRPSHWVSYERFGPQPTRVPEKTGLADLATRGPAVAIEHAETSDAPAEVPVAGPKGRRKRNGENAAEVETLRQRLAELESTAGRFMASAGGGGLAAPAASAARGQSRGLALGGGQALESESESGTGGELDQEDDPGDLGNALAGLGNVLGSDRAASGRGRALAPRSEERTADPIEAVLAAMGTGGVDSVKGSKKGGGMDDLMKILMLKEVRKLQREEKKKQLKKGQESDDDDNTSSEDPDDRRGNAVDVSFNKLRRMHASYRQRPRKTIKAYRRFVKTELGVRDGDPWRWRQIWDRMPFRAYRSMGRMVFLNLTILELCDSVKTEDDLDVVRAALIQSVKAGHQMAIDGGNWKAAWMLTGQRDPYTRAEWGGEESELATVAGYLKASTELREKVAAVSGPGNWSQQPSGGGRAEDEVEEADSDKKGTGKGKDKRGRPPKKPPA